MAKEIYCGNCGGKLHQKNGEWFHVDRDRVLCPQTQALPVLAPGITPYWGLYCPQHDVWLHSDKGIGCWPSPSIVDALLNSYHKRWMPNHLWQVTKFGDQSRLPEDQALWSPSTEVCKGSQDLW